jgi:DNA-binding CsgD family transcriptional regulator
MAMTPTRCQEFIEAIGRAGNVEEIHHVCADICQEFGFEQFIYAASVPTSFVKPSLIIISGYAREWREHYNTQHYMGVDPTVAYCAHNILPLNWANLATDTSSNPLLHRFMSEARDFGLSSGISFPIHTAQGDSAMLSLASPEQHPKTQPRIIEAMPYGQLFTAYLHETVRQVFAEQMLPISRADLTPREQECLLWVTEGKTTWETSQILNISERTVTFHLQNTVDKLGVVNRQQAVARAVALGIIRPQFN